MYAIGTEASVINNANAYMDARNLPRERNVFSWSEKLRDKKRTEIPTKMLVAVVKPFMIVGINSGDFMGKVTSANMVIDTILIRRTSKSMIIGLIR
jgi:hypothetical protein